MPAPLVFGAVLMALLSWAVSLYGSPSSLGAPAATVAAALIEYHQAAVAAVLADSSLNGTITPTLPAWKPAGPFVACADTSGAVVTYSTADLYPSAGAVARELARLEWDAAGYGLSGGGVVQQRTGAAIPLPCPLGDGLAVAVTRTR